MTTTSAFVLKHLQVKSRLGFEWLCLCPYHKDSNPSFSINIKKKLFICYACGAKGNIRQLMEHLGVSDSLDKEELSVNELSEKIRGVSDLVSNTQRPPVGIPIPPRIYADADAIHNYWTTTRKLSPFTVTSYKLGYDILNDEAIIPVRDINGHNIGIIRRTFDSTRPRYLYSKGMKTSEVVFGAYEALELAKNSGRKGVLVITEGAIDAMTIHNFQTTKVFYVGVAILGSRISKQQAEIIKRLGFEEIIIATDMDRAGKMAQIQVQTMLKDVKCSSLIYKAFWELSFGKDLNSLDKDHAYDILNKSRTSVHDFYASQIIQTTPSSTSTSGNGLYKVTYNKNISKHNLWQ